MNLFDALLEEGTSKYLVLCYSVFSVSEIDTAYNQMMATFVEETHFKLHESQWPYAILLTEARLDEISKVLPTAIKLMARSFDTDKCKAAICMLDGAFYNYDDMFSPDISEQIYAFCVKHKKPVAVLDDIIRSSDEWKSIIAKQRQHVV